MTGGQGSQVDFFVADALDAAPKADLSSMEHPLFALKAGDRRVRRYERNGHTVEVQPGPHGCATIHDKDLWIYCISQMIEAMKTGRKDVTRKVRFRAYDFLVTTHRGVNGASYKRMSEALRRLGGTRIETNVVTDGRRERGGFGLIEAWRVIEPEQDDRATAVEVTLPDWLWRSVRARNVLTLNREYFRLRRPLDRRIYELARKHVGAQPSWKVSLATLHEKSGSTATLREFRRLVKVLAQSNGLPEYRMTLNTKGDTLAFYSRSPKGGQVQVAAMLGGLKKRLRV